MTEDEKRQEEAYWDLRGLIAQWMEEAGQDRASSVMSLHWIMAEWQMALYSTHARRLARLEQILGLPAAPGEGVRHERGEAGAD
jgi:hypothetical protein